MNIVNNEKELLKAVNDNVSEIVLEGEWKIILLKFSQKIVFHG